MDDMFETLHPNLTKKEIKEKAHQFKVRKKYNCEETL